MSLSLQGHLPLQFGLANVEGCRISANDRPISPVRSERSAAVAVQHYRLSHAAAKIAVRCPAR
jgi:hypothetical protein